MRLLRLLLLLLMLVAVLPWGAYVNGSARFAATAPAAAAGDALAPEARGERRVVLGAERPCRKGTLPGSPCGPDLGLLPFAAGFAGLGAGSLRPPSDGPDPAGLSRAPPTEPPRLG